MHNFTDQNNVSETKGNEFATIYNTEKQQIFFKQLELVYVLHFCLKM